METTFGRAKVHTGTKYFPPEVTTLYDRHSSETEALGCPCRMSLSYDVTVHGSWFGDYTIHSSLFTEMAVQNCFKGHISGK